MTEFTTAISEVRAGAVNLRGYSLADVMTELTYTQGAHLTIIGRLPDPAEEVLLNAVLNSLLDHGFVASTITAARYIASGNPQLVPAVAGGMLAAGANTLSPADAFHLLDDAARRRELEGLTIEQAAMQIVQEFSAAKRRIPGFGHPTHKDSDFRADILFDLAERNGLQGESISQYRAIHEEFLRGRGKGGIPINIDGALASLGRDLGWTVNQTVSFAMLSVLPGVMAHVIEEISANRPLRHITDGAYVGASLEAISIERT